MSNFPHEAIQAIIDTLEVGMKKYSPAYWRGRPASEHIDHADTHFYKMNLETGENLYDDDPEDHLAHALTRLAMAWCVREAEKK